MTPGQEIEIKSRGYEVEVRNLDTGRSVVIVLMIRGKRWVVKANRFYGSYSTLKTAVNEALRIVGESVE